MRTLIAWTALSALLLPLFVGAAAGLVVTDPAAKVQRVTIMANQVTQATTLTEQLTEMRSQLDHMREAARGEIEALTAPFTELASQGTGLVSDAMSWKSQFSGVPGQLANAVADMGNSGTSLTTTWSGWLQQADVVSEADITALYTNLSPILSQDAAEGWRKSRQRADNKIVMNQALADAAAELAKSLKDAQQSLDSLKNQTNMSNTALAQAQLSGSLTQGNLATAMAQVQAYKAVLESTEAFQKEQQRRDRLSDWADAQRAAQQNLQSRNTAIRSQAGAMRESLRIGVNPYYGSSYGGN